MVDSPLGFAPSNDLRQRWALLQLQQAGDASPVRSPLQAVARALQGAMGGYIYHQQQEDNKAAMSGLLDALSNPAATAAAPAAIPASPAASPAAPAMSGPYGNNTAQTASGDSIPLPPANPLGRLNPEFRQKFADLRSAAAEQGVNFNAPEDGSLGNVRTPEQQAALYAQGRTAPGPVVTGTMHSNHLTGQALDVVPTDGSTAKQIGSTVTDLIRNDPRFAGMRSGATFSNLYDPLHVELNKPGTQVASLDPSAGAGPAQTPANPGAPTPQRQAQAILGGQQGQQPQYAAPAPAQPAMPDNVRTAISAAMSSNSPQAQALAAQLLTRYAQPHNYSFSSLPDGTIVRQDPQTGAVQPVYQSSKPTFVPNASHDQYGNPLGGFVDATKGTVSLIGTNGQPINPQATAAGPGGVNGDLHGEDFLKTIDPGKAETVKGIAEGRIPYPSGFIMKTPYGQWLTQAVGQYEPGIDANIIAQRRKMQTDIAASSPNSIGGILSNGKSAFEHLAELSDKAVGLGSMNGPDIPGGGAMAHVGNYVGSALGTSDTKAKIGAFNQNALKYGQESTKFYAGTGGGEAERMNALKSLNPETSSGAEQAAFLENEKGLMLDRLRQKEAQIRDVLGDKYLQQHPVMTKELQSTIDRIDTNIARLRGGASNAAPAQSGPSKADIEAEMKRRGLMK